MSNTISLEGGWVLKLEQDYIAKSLHDLMNSILPEPWGYDKRLNDLYDDSIDDEQEREKEERELIGAILQELMPNGRNLVGF